MIREEKIKVCLWTFMSALDRRYKRLNKLLKPINYYGKVIRYNVNIQKSIAILCTNQKLEKFEMESTIFLTLAPLRTEASRQKCNKTCTESQGRKQ